MELANSIAEVFGFRIPLTPAVVLPLLVFATIFLAYVLYLLILRIIEFVSSEELQQLAERMVNQPPAVIARVKKPLGQKTTANYSSSGSQLMIER
jgi:hypothetical protein